MKPVFLSSALQVSPLILAATLFAKANPALSQASNIVPDDTLGEESSQVIENFDGQPVEVITGGAQREQNLFHSFQEFNVSEGRGAYFNSPNVDVQNIFSRVTGSNPSEIMGVLGTFGESNPDLYLVNPNGIVFGENASLDVQGSFTATTAEAIEFSEGGFFSAVAPGESLLTISVPLGLQFGSTPGSIVNRSFVEDSTGELVGLQVPSGESLTLVGGEVRFEAGEATARGGNINIGGLGTAGTVSLSDDGSLSFPDEVDRADITFTNAADVDVRGAGGGNINANANNLIIEAGESGSSQIRAGIIANSTSPEALAGNIAIDATGDFIVTDSLILNEVNSEAVGNAGNITIKAKNINSNRGSIISSGTFGQGNSGNISITADNAVTLNDTSYIANNVQSSEAVGNAGRIEIDTGSLSATNGSQINSFTRGRGNAGNITIKAADAITFDGVDGDNNYSKVSSSVEAGGVGNGGDINITANSLSLTNGAELNASVDEASNFLSANFDINSNASSSSGNISILASNITLDNSADIFASNFIGEDGGNISINTVKLQLNNGSDIFTTSGTFTSSEQQKSGASGKLKIEATDSISLDNNSYLFTAATGFGSGGDIVLDTKNIFIDDGIISSSAINIGEFLKTSSETLDLNFILEILGFDPAEGVSVDEFINNFVNENINDDIEQGNSGNVIIKASESVSIISQNRESNTAGILTSGTGNANGGNISITSPKLRLIQGTITTGTAGAGNSGNIDITNAENIEIIGGTLSANTSINSSGSGGDLKISTQNLLVEEGGSVSTSTEGAGDSGDISIAVNNTISLDDSTIVNNVQARKAVGNAGRIEITTGFLSATNGSQINSFTRGRGNAGDITIQATNAATFDGVDSDNKSSGVFGSVEAGGVGDGGDINITAGLLFLTNGAELNASVREASNTLPGGNGQGGNLTIAAGDIELRGDSNITTNISSGEGSGGNITLTADSIIAFDDCDIFAFAADGRGGNITFNTPAFFAENFTLNSLTTNPGLLENNNRADVNATGAVSSGAVDIPDVSFIQNSLTELPDNSINTDELVANSCVVPVGDRSQGKFIITGGESLPVRPGGNLPSKYPTGEVRGVTEDNTNSWQPGDPIVEPQGAYRLANGKLVLSRECS